MSPSANTIIALPRSLPSRFAEVLGYRGERRFVAAYWEPLGDEVTVCDDRSSAIGLGDHYAWSDFVHQPNVHTWLRDRDVNLGNSDETATHWLIIDRVRHLRIRCSSGPGVEAYRAAEVDGR